MSWMPTLAEELKDREDKILFPFMTYRFRDIPLKYRKHGSLTCTFAFELRKEEDQPSDPPMSQMWFMEFKFFLQDVMRTLQPYLHKELCEPFTNKKMDDYFKTLQYQDGSMPIFIDKIKRLEEMDGLWWKATRDRLIQANEAFRFIHSPANRLINMNDHDKSTTRRCFTLRVPRALSDQRDVILGKILHFLTPFVNKQVTELGWGSVDSYRFDMDSARGPPDWERELMFHLIPDANRHVARLLQEGQTQSAPASSTHKRSREAEEKKMTIKFNSVYLNPAFHKVKTAGLLYRPDGHIQDNLPFRIELYVHPISSTLAEGYADLDSAMGSLAEIMRLFPPPEKA